jgi:hypothetical protein
MEPVGLTTRHPSNSKSCSVSAVRLRNIGHGVCFLFVTLYHENCNEVTLGFIYNICEDGRKWDCRDFFLDSPPCTRDRICGPHGLLSNLNRGIFPRVKRPGSDADHSTTTSDEVQENLGLCIHFTINDGEVIN